MSTHIGRWWTLPAVVGALVAALVLLASTSGAASGADTPSDVKASDLAAAPSLSQESPGRSGGAQARAAAERDLGHVPLPAGGTVNGIRWEEAQVVFTEAEIETVVEYNAMCQWLRAARDGRGEQEALNVLDHVPQWPGFRDQPDVSLTQQVVAEAHAGSGPALAAALADCDRSHQREVAYAQSMNLPASS